MSRDRELNESGELNESVELSEYGEVNEVGDLNKIGDGDASIDSIGSSELSEPISNADVAGLINVIKSIKLADETESEGLVEDSEVVDSVDGVDGNKDDVSDQLSDQLFNTDSAQSPAKLSGQDKDPVVDSESGSLRKLVTKRRKFFVGVLSVLFLVMLGSVIYELSFDRGYELSVEGVQGVYGDYLVDMNDDLLEGDNLANLMDTYFSEQLRDDVDLETSRVSFEETIGKGMTFNGEVTGTKIVEDPEGNVIRIEVSVLEWLAEPGEEVLPDEKGIGVYTFIEEDGRVVISDMVDYTNATEVDEDGKIKE